MFKLCVENYDWKILKTKKPCGVEGRVDGWMDGWMNGKAGLRIAYSNQKETVVNLR